MPRLTALLGGALLAACAGEPQPEPPPPPPPAPTVADFAGHWVLTHQIEGVADPVMAEMQGSAGGSDWAVIVAADRPPIPAQVSMSGDSLIATTAPYESVLRPGSMVTVRIAGVMQDGRLVGNSVLTYDTAGQQEVVTGTFTGEPAPADPAPME